VGEAVSGRLADYLERVAALAPVIREHAERSERESRLAQPIAEALHQAGLFRILLPRGMGGGELTIPESLRVFEAVARLDASTGWNLVICGDGPIFGHFVEREAFEKIFSEPRAVLVGSLNPVTIRAVAGDDGWSFTGRATFVSGSAQATWIMVSGLEVRDGKPNFAGGVPVMRSGLFPLGRCKVQDTWDVTGMRGTGSHDVTFEDVFVPRAFTYEWPNPAPTWSTGPYASIPLTTQLGGGLASVAIGAAQHAVDAFTELALSKVPTGGRATLRERSSAQIELAQATGLVRAAREYLHAANEAVWRMGETREPFDDRARADARLASVTAVKLCKQAVDLLHDAAGMTAVQRGQDLERCWRDVHTLSQHIILGATRFETVGRILLGLEPGSPII
jgi:alkylation response protein AidB-like acyl-CoA dehydrogenase